MVDSRFVRTLTLLCLLALPGGFSFPADTTPSDSDAASPPQVLHLHTEFLPYETSVDRGIPYRMGRELIRQAVLLAARDELGAATCDETLQESVSRAADIVYLMPMERADLTGKWNVKLIPYTAGKEPWEKTYDYIPSGDRMYADMIPKLEADTRNAFRDALLSAGLRNDKPRSQDPAAPGDGIERLLGEVDFVSQFGAVRAAHQAIAAHGETPEWLGVLVRGYAHLALLTRHHWSTATEVFTARSWLYAQRMWVATRESEQALWHRTYAWALGGALHHALADLEMLEERRAGADATRPPAWTRLIQPYCRFDRAELRKVGLGESAWEPWAVRLEFEIVSAYLQPNWMFEVAQRARQSCPAAFGIYADLVNQGSTLGLKRSGAAWGSEAFNHFVPRRVGRLPQLPERTAQLVARTTRRAGGLRSWFGQSEPPERFSTAPITLAGQLRRETEEGLAGDLSWSALASLIEEEQFILAVSHVRNARDAVEHSLAEDVDALKPLVQQHRFAALIDSQRYHLQREWEKVHETLQGLRVRDPRRNMEILFLTTWQLPDGLGSSVGYMAYSHAQRNFTLPGMLEYVRPLLRMTDPPEDPFAEIFARELRLIAPHSDLGALLEVTWTKAPTPEQLQGWQDELRQDPRAITMLAKRYNESGDVEAAIRCFERSLDLIPTVDATMHLAQLYQDQRQWDAWERTLLAFLETEDLGLQHGSVKEMLAAGYCRRGLWRKAKPHAVDYGQTWAARGLSLASEVTEGLAEWEESEGWARALSESYGSTSGYEWYFWCRRTGRGDVQAAQELAEAFFAQPRNQTREHFIFLGAYHLLRSDIRAAFNAYQRAASFHPSYSCTFSVAHLARELKDERMRTEVLDAMEKAVLEQRIAGQPRDQDVDAAGMAILQLFRSRTVTQEQLDALEGLLSKLESVTRSALAYHAGIALLQMGREAEAELFWRRTLVTSFPDLSCATLAAVQLAERRGLARPDDDVLDETDLWPAPVADK